MAYNVPRPVSTATGSSTNNGIATYSGTAGDVLQSPSAFTISGAALTGLDSGNTSINATSNGSTTSGFFSASATGTTNTTGDAFSRYSVSPSGVITAFYWGIDNSDNQTFKLTRSNSNSNSIPTTNELLEVTANVVQFAQGQAVKRTATATNYTVLANDYYVGVTDTSAPRTITLPNTGLVTNQIFVIKDEGGQAAGNNITITVSGGAILIDGSTTYVLRTNYGSIQLLWNGTKFLVF